MKQFVLRHWHGMLPAHISLFGVLIGFGIALHIGLGGLADRLDLYLAGLVIAVTAAVLIWQIIGTLRSSERHLKSGGDTLLYWGSYAAAIGLALVLLMDAITLVSPATRANPVPPQQVVELQVQGDTILLEGFIGFRTHTALLTRLQAPDAGYTTLRLNSNGGRVFAARAIANALILHDINTEITGRCASACTLIFLAGKQRHLLGNGQLGFHQYLQTSGIQFLDTAKEQQKDSALFKSRGVSDAFIADMFQAEHQDIWFPSRNDLLRAGVLTD